MFIACPLNKKYWEKFGSFHIIYCPIDEERINIPVSSVLVVNAYLLSLIDDSRLGCIRKIDLKLLEYFYLIVLD